MRIVLKLAAIAAIAAGAWTPSLHAGEPAPPSPAAAPAPPAHAPVSAVGRAMAALLGQVRQPAAPSARATATQAPPPTVAATTQPAQPRVAPRRDSVDAEQVAVH
jgi:hypothetical protein